MDLHGIVCVFVFLFMVGVLFLKRWADAEERKQILRFNVAAVQKEADDAWARYEVALKRHDFEQSALSDDLRCKAAREYRRWADSLDHHRKVAFAAGVEC